MAKSLVTFAANRPKTFKKTVSIPVAGGTPFDIEIEFKNLTSREEAVLRDSVEAATDGKKKDDQTPLTWVGIADSRIGNDVMFLMGVMVGWKAPDNIPFSRDTLDQLLDEYRGAGAVIGEAFNVGVKGGAAGN